MDFWSGVAFDVDEVLEDVDSSADNGTSVVVVVVVIVVVAVVVVDVVVVASILM